MKQQATKSFPTVGMFLVGLFSDAHTLVASTNYECSFFVCCLFVCFAWLIFKCRKLNEKIDSHNQIIITLLLPVLGTLKQRLVPTRTMFKRTHNLTAYCNVDVYFLRENNLVYKIAVLVIGVNHRKGIVC